MNIYNYISLVSVVILIALILVQTRGASLGAGFGGAGSGEINMTRRGTDMTLHQITIFVAFVFASSLIMHLVA
ncbi:MAG: preprotein translocase subunit SecG [Candidatus Saccharibacteria bacterium]|nr:preprotein translocase subunit SecG [Candidatus Saccharibacteria bacterium]